MINWLISRFDEWWLRGIDIGLIHDITLYDLMMYRIRMSWLETGNAYIAVYGHKLTKEWGFSEPVMRGKPIMIKTSPPLHDKSISE